MIKSLIILFVLATGYLSYTYIDNKSIIVDDDTPIDTIGVITHDEARELCEEMNLVYDYEAEGTTPSEFCIKDNK